MLQNIRHSLRGTAAKVIIGLIVVTFAAFGIESILVGGGGSSAAEVNGEEIPAQELQRAVIIQQQRLISAMGEDFDPALIEEDRLRSQALQELIGRKLLTQSANAMRLTVPESTLGRVIGGMEEFQIDGAFSRERFQQILSDNGYSPAAFKRALRNDMLLAQVRAGIAASEFATPAELESVARISAETRDFRYLTIPRESFISDEPIDEAEIEAYYREHESSFLTEESVDLSYIHLSLDDFREPVDESEIVEAFEAARANFPAATEYRVSHILVSDDAGDAAERLTAAQERLANGEAFADVARELSDDAGSASRGGELGYTTGEAFPREMEAAIATLEPGQVSAPVRTDAGTHLLLVTERREASPPELDDMREQLSQSLQRGAAEKALVLTVESLRDLSFNARDLSEPAAELGLEVERAQGVKRNQSEGLFAHTSLREAAFSIEVLNQGYNSEVIELPGNEFVVLRLAQHHMPEVQPLAAVRDEIVASIRAERTREALTGRAREMLAELRAGASIEQLAVQRGYEWQVELGAERRSFAVAPEVLRRVFALPAEAPANASDFVTTDAGDVVLFELIRAAPGDYSALAAQRQEQLHQQIAGEYASLLDAQYRARLRQAADIKLM